MAAAWLIVFVLFYLVVAFSVYGTFQKAGVPTWWAFVPIIQVLGVFRVAGRPLWWILLLLIPIVDIIVVFVVLNDVSVSFGHGIGFTLGLFFLPIVFFYIVSYGDSQYHGAIGAIPAASDVPPGGDLAP